ncbi:MAG: hypothetical protein DMG70_05110, partial [Acidobacteria bacterium]
MLATVATIDLSATFILIFRFVVLSVEASLALLWPTASGLIASRSPLKTKVLVARMGGFLPRSIRAQERLDCAALVHCTVALCHLIQGQR